MGVRQLERLRGPGPLVATPKDLSEGCFIERACQLLAVEVENLQHSALLVQEGYSLDSAGVEDTEDLLAELLDSGALYTANSGVLPRRQEHRGSATKLNDRMTLIENK